MSGEPPTFGARVGHADPGDGGRVVIDAIPGDATPPRLFARRLELRTLLGTGKCGETWRAYHHVLGRDVAVKILSRSDARSPALADLRREAMALDKLSHRAFPRIYECDHDDDGSWYLVEEFIDGEPLTRTIQRGAMEPLAAVELVIELAEALEEAHARGILHGDISFTNLMLERSLPPRPRIIDFSECRLLDLFYAATDQRYARAPHDRGDSRQTCGHPGFAAPELYRGGSKTERGDVYSLGAVLFMLLTAAQMPNAVIRELLSEETGGDGERLREHLVGLVPALEDTFIAADFQDILALDPALRVKTMSDLLELLRAERDALRTLRSGDRGGQTASVVATAARATAPVRYRYGSRSMSKKTAKGATRRRWAGLAGVSALATAAGLWLLLSPEPGAGERAVDAGAAAVTPGPRSAPAAAPVPPVAELPAPTRDEVVAAVVALTPRLQACPDAPRRLPIALEVGATTRLVELKYGEVVDSLPLDRCVRALVESLRFAATEPARHAMTIDLAIAHKPGEADSR